MSLKKASVVVVVCFVLLGAPSFAQDKPVDEAVEEPAAAAENGEELTADEIAKKMSNPAAAVMGLSSNLDYRSFEGSLPGAADQSSLTYLFQPGFPFPQPSGSNILFRPAIPVVFDQPLFNAQTGSFEDSGTELLDIGFDLALGTTKASGLLYFFGLVGNVPAATSDDLRGEWAFGPEGAIGKVTKWGVYGALVSHQWDVGGGSGQVNITGGQYFYSISLTNGWQISAGPTFSYNHITSELTLPLGTGLTKTRLIGKMPIKIGGQIWYYVDKPDAFGPEWLVRFTVTPVVPIPWAK